MPVVAKTLGGKSLSKFLSKKAYFGTSRIDSIGNFSPVLSFLTTAATVVSLPVPEVVGKAIINGIL